MKKLFLSLSLLGLGTLSSLGQPSIEEADPFRSYMSVGLHTTPHFWRETTGGFLYKELAHVLRLSYHILPRLQVGSGAYWIWTHNPRDGGMSSYLIGTYAQYAVYREESFQMFLDVGYFQGNYCPCSDVLPPYQEAQRGFGVWGFGFAYTPRKFPKLQISGRLAVHYLLQADLSLQQGFYTGFIGIDYELKFKER